MAMTRKHYDQFANLLAYYHKHSPDMTKEDMLHNITLDMCSIFKRDNSNFDSDRFKEASRKEPNLSKM